MSGDGLTMFDVVRGDELMRLTWDDHDQLDALAGDAEGTRLWWQLRRREWAEEEAGADGR